jgi:hypothetical protein
MIGNTSQDALVTDIEAYCKEASKKPVKLNKKGDVKFDFKIKGQKPVVTKGVCQFNITGSDFNSDKIAEIMAKHGIVEMD